MADVLTAIKSVRGQDHGLTDEVALRPVEPVAVSATQAPTRSHTTSRVAASPDDVLETLRSQPTLDELIAVLRLLLKDDFRTGLNIHAPGPRQAQIINALLTHIIPSFWSVAEQQLVALLVLCLHSVAGFNAVFAKLRLLCSNDGSGMEKSQISSSLIDLLGLTEHLLRGDSTLVQLWRNLYVAVPDKLKRDMAWKEVVGLVGSGKIPSALAQAEDLVKDNGKLNRGSAGLADSAVFAQWLGRNICAMLRHAHTAEHELVAVAAAQVFVRSLSLGYSNHLLTGLFYLYTNDTSKTSDLVESLVPLLQKLPDHAKQRVIEDLLRWLSFMTASSDDQAVLASRRQTDDVRAVAALLALIFSADEAYQGPLISVITSPALSSTVSMTVRRACLASISSLSSGEDHIQPVLDKLMSHFNDNILIMHSPIFQQECLTQSLLLSAGYLHRKMPVALLMSARSSNHMQAISNRLDSSNARARWLGMIVGTAVSGLVDKEGSRMSFGTEDMETDEAKWYMGLVNVDDPVGLTADFKEMLSRSTSSLSRPRREHLDHRMKEMPQINGKPTFGPVRPPAQTEIVGDRVTEVCEDDIEDDDDGLKPYAKPDSDPEDSDEDATLVNRKKVRPPVYVRDLMAMLRDDQNHDRFVMGIKNAAALIRRKANFGSEVRDHAEEIGAILGNLSNPFDVDDFEQLKLQAMIAVILSDVEVMAPWFARQAFAGEYSIAQRCVMLSALGLSGRELAGLKSQDDLNPDTRSSDFPTKRLPPHLHAIYSPANAPAKRLEAASSDVEHALVKPLALQAADQSTAHLNAVKVRTFSSRMEVERTKRKPAANALAKVFGKAYFYPLLHRYQQEIGAYGSATLFSSVPFLLVTFVKTMSLLLHAAGPATLGLQDMIGEFWSLLLSLRVQALQDIAVLHAVLFSLLTILQLGTDSRRIVDEYPKQLVETQQWVSQVFDQMGGNELVSDDASNIETKIRTLSAGILLKTKEVIGTYQKELVGYSFD